MVGSHTKNAVFTQKSAKIDINNAPTWQKQGQTPADGLSPPLTEMVFIMLIDHNKGTRKRDDDAAIQAVSQPVPLRKSGIADHDSGV